MESYPCIFIKILLVIESSEALKLILSRPSNETGKQLNVTDLFSAPFFVPKRMQDFVDANEPNAHSYKNMRQAAKLINGVVEDEEVKTTTKTPATYAVTTENDYETYTPDYHLLIPPTSYKAGIISDILSRGRNDLSSTSMASLREYFNKRTANPTNTRTESSENASAVQFRQLLQNNTKAKQQLQQMQQMQPLMSSSFFPLFSYNNKIIHHMEESTSKQEEQQQQQQQQQIDEDELNYQRPKIRMQRSSNFLYDPHLENDDDDGADNDAYKFRANPQDIIRFKEFRYLHDFFMKYHGPHHVHFGHVERRPRLFERRFQMVRGGNRFKGEVIWSDDKGSYGEHYWDLAIGRL